MKGLSEQQVALMERESASLDRQFELAEQPFSVDQFDLVLAKGYISKLLGNARMVRHLAQRHQDILGEFQRVVEVDN